MEWPTTSPSPLGPYRGLEDKIGGTTIARDHAQDSSRLGPERPDVGGVRGTELAGGLADGSTLFVTLQPRLYAGDWPLGRRV